MKRFLLIHTALLISILVFSACDEATERVKIGKIAPDFELKDQNGITHILSSYIGKSNVVLYFYPKDDTPGCTKEACSFRDDISAFDSLNTVILGVSVDDIESHKLFENKYELNFTLLSDQNKEVSEKYNVLSPKGKSKRYTFIIDKKGIVRRIYEKVDIGIHSKEIINYIKTM